MANYINKDILCQAYIHIDPVPLNEEDLTKFKNEIESFLQERGKFFIYDEIDTSVELKDGSLKFYGTILGSLYLAISSYGSFRSGIDFLASDVKRVSDTVVSESLFLTKSRHKDIKRVEARIGIVGSVKQIVDEIDYIKSRLGLVDPATLAKRMDKLTESIIRMQKKLKDPKDAPYINNNLKILVMKNIPEKPIPVPRKTLKKESELYYRDERKRLLGQLKV